MYPKPLASLARGRGPSEPSHSRLVTWSEEVSDPLSCRSAILRKMGKAAKERRREARTMARAIVEGPNELQPTSFRPGRSEDPNELRSGASLVSRQAFQRAFESKRAALAAAGSTTKTVAVSGEKGGGDTIRAREHSLEEASWKPTNDPRGQLRKPQYNIIEDPAEASMREAIEICEQMKKARRNHRRKQNFLKKKAKKQEQQRALHAKARDQYILLEHFQDGMRKLTPKQWREAKTLHAGIQDFQQSVQAWEASQLNLVANNSKLRPSK